LSTTACGIDSFALLQLWIHLPTLSLRVPLFAERANPLHPPPRHPRTCNSASHCIHFSSSQKPASPPSNTKPVASHPGGLTIPPPRVHSETNSRAHHARTTRPTSHHITSHKHAVYDIPEVKRNTLVSHCASYIVYLAGAEPGCGYAARCTAVAVLQSGGRVHRHAVQGTKTGLLSIDFGELVVAVVAMAARSQDASLASMVNNPGLRGLCR
jgi:hypothetical protein